MPPRSHRDLALDGLRGLAILLVFAFHYGGGLRSPHLLLRILGHLAESGWTGVVLFFALSGFLITAGLWPAMLRASSPSGPVTAIFSRFYLRRAFRILPLYLLAVGLACLAALYAHTRLITLAIYALFLQDLPGLAGFAIAHPPPLPLYHLWSLAVEEQFYLLWPAFLLLAARAHAPRRAALHLCLWIFVLAAAFRILVYGFVVYGFAPQAQLFDTFLLTHAGALALGAALSLAMAPDDGNGPQHTNSFTPAIDRLALPALFLGLALYLLSSGLSRSFQLASPLQYMVGLPAMSLAAAALVALALRAGVARRLLSLQPLPWLGRISYGFYVFHILLQPLFDRIALALAHTASGSLYQTVRLLAAFPITLLAAWLSFHRLETPILRRSSRFSLPAQL